MKECPFRFPLIFARSSRERTKLCMFQSTNDPRLYTSRGSQPGARIPLFRVKAASRARQRTRLDVPRLLNWPKHIRSKLRIGDYRSINYIATGSQEKLRALSGPVGKIYRPRLARPYQPW